jgi:glycosyltransferase involved in cell wall biosynthesis
MRAYVRNDAFFRAVPLVLAALPGTRFLCPAMAGEPQAERWVKELGIEEAVDLLPPQSRMQMAGLFRQSQVAVSPSEHDGTPNTLLEAMACGCFPVAGDIESVGEWIEDGLNGLLVDPGDPSALAAGIVQAFNDEQLRQEAQAHNLILIVEKATYRVVMEKAEGFYKMIVSPT